VGVCGSHSNFCWGCVEKYAVSALEELKVLPFVKCPDPGCKERLDLKVVSVQTRERIEFRVKQLEAQLGRQCVNCPLCSFQNTAVENQTMLSCASCKFVFCLDC